MAVLYRRPFVAETTATRPAAAMCERESAADAVATHVAPTSSNGRLMAFPKID